MQLGIVAQRGNDRATELAAELYDDLGAEDVEIVADPATAEATAIPGVPIADMTGFALVVSVGGDGTFLFAARNVGSTPIVGVNLGEVGFLNAVPPGEATARVREELARIREKGAPRYREVDRIRAAGDGWSLPAGLNEVVVQGPQRGHGQGIDLEVRVDGSLYAGGHADGVLVATPTGSTAYNLSEGGPLVHPGVSGLLVTEMCAVESMPPLVVPPEQSITIRAEGPGRAVVASDGGERRWLDAPADVTVEVATEPARIAGPRSDFFRALNKLD